MLLGEVDLCFFVCLRLPHKLTRDDVIAERCGVRPLAVSASSKRGADWAQLSRKHAVEVDVPTRHISIFGGKLTDCLNVGEEIARHVASLGVALPYPQAHWYGEPPDESPEHATSETATARFADRNNARTRVGEDMARTLRR